MPPTRDCTCLLLTVHSRWPCPDPKSLKVVRTVLAARVCPMGDVRNGFHDPCEARRWADEDGLALTLCLEACCCNAQIRRTRDSSFSGSERRRSVVNISSAEGHPRRSAKPRAQQRGSQWKLLLNASHNREGGGPETEAGMAIASRRSGWQSLVTMLTCSLDPAVGCQSSST